MSSSGPPARSQARARVTAAAVLALAALAILPAATVVPHSPQPADAGELQLVARELGIAHPPGYPLYTVAAHAFGRVVVALAPGAVPALPGATVQAGAIAVSPAHPAWPYAINLFSAGLALATLALVALAGHRAGGSWRGGLIAAVVLATCPTFIVLALVANIRQATAALAAACIWAAIAVIEGARRGDVGAADRDRAAGIDARARSSRGGLGVPSGRSGPAGGPLLGLAIAFGLAAGHHLSLVFLALPIGISLLAAGAIRGLPARALGRAMLAGGLAWLLPQLYLPLRDAAGAALGPGDLQEPEALWRFVTGADFRGDLLGAAEAGRLLDRARIVLDVLALQLGPFGLALCGLGAARGVGERRSRPTALLLAGSAAITAALAILYRAPQTVEYLMPAYVALAVLAGSGAAILDRWSGRMAGLAGRAWHNSKASAVPDRGLAAAPSAGGAVGRADRVAAWLAATVVGSALLARALVGGVPGAALEMASANGLDSAFEIALAAAGCADSPGGEAPLGAPASGDAASSAGERDDSSAGATGTRASSETRAAGRGRSSTILAAWHFATPLWLAVDPGARDRIRYVAPDWSTGDPIGLTWAKALDRARRDGAVILTNRTREIIDSGRPLWPLRGTPFFTDRPHAGCEPGFGGSPVPDARAWPPQSNSDGAVGRAVGGARAGIAPIPTGGIIALDLNASSVERRGGHAEVWAELRSIESAAGDETRRLVEPLSISLRLVAPDDGTIWAQADRTLEASRWNDPRGVALRVSLVPFAGDVPQQLDAVALLYRHSADGPSPVPWAGGRERIAIGAVDARGWARPPHPPAAIPFGDAMVLEDSRVVIGADEARVELIWRAHRAFVSDYTVSVHASGDGWLAQHDGTPALGALPTLKWLPGWRVRDVHVIRLPAGRPPDAPVTISVSVYDAFSLEPLPVTDPERVHAGQGERVTVFGLR